MSEGFVAMITSAKLEKMFESDASESGSTEEVFATYCYVLTRAFFRELPECDARDDCIMHVFDAMIEAKQVLEQGEPSEREMETIDDRYTSKPWPD